MSTAVTETGTILDRIVARTIDDVASRKQATPIAELEARIQTQQPAIDVRSALRRDHVTVIAEFKRASPSKGRFSVDIEPESVVTAYVGGGASAISCLTDEPFFQGSLADLETASRIAGDRDEPVGALRKDFMVDSYQVVEARAYGASCILLIAACLDDARMIDLANEAKALGMSVLTEVHDERELERALACGADLIGVNNRDLRTFDVSLETTTRLATLVPPDVVFVGESGIFTRDHVREMAEAGVDAVLVGESLILQPDRAAAVRELAGVRKHARG